jgi:hypothetical protein
MLLHVRVRQAVRATGGRKLDLRTLSLEGYTGITPAGTGRCSRRARWPHQGNDSSFDGITPRRIAPPRSQVGDSVAWHERGRWSARRYCLDQPWTHEYVSVRHSSIVTGATVTGVLMVGSIA